ncbi:MAG: prolipoprotein diacylglyceryl transferase family protein [Patescibacteria group bacterium]
MQPVLFEVGPFKLYSFGTFIALGALVGGLTLFRLLKHRKLRTSHLFDVVLYTLIIALIGSRLTYYFTYQDQFKNFWQVFYFWQGGLLALGGILIGFIAFLRFVRKAKQPIWEVLDAAGLTFLVGWAIGKIGCHLSLCTIGRATDSWVAVNGAFPIDLFSSIWAIVVFGILLYIYLKDRFSAGIIFFLAAESFLLGELLIKTLKADFGEGIVRAEAMIYLALVVITYLLFWRFHGPQIDKPTIRQFFGKLLKRFRR